MFLMYNILLNTTEDITVNVPIISNERVKVAELTKTSLKPVLEK